MDNSFKNLVIFAAGAAIGAFASKKYFDKQTEDFIYSEVDRLVSEEIGKIARTKGTPNHKSKEESPYEKIVDIYTGNVHPAEEEFPREEVEYENQRDNEYYEYERASKEANDNNVDIDPHQITLEEFTEDETAFEKLILYYYSKDNILADEDEVVITDKESIIGDAPLNFGFDTTTGDGVLYIRNPKMRSDFEIIRVEESYFETVLGVVPEEGDEDDR